MIHVISIIIANSGMREALLKVFKEIVPAVRKEPGCLEYTAMGDADETDPGFGSDTFVVIEKWENHAAFKTHKTAAPLRSFMTGSRALLNSLSLHVLREL